MNQKNQSKVRRDKDWSKDKKGKRSNWNKSQSRFRSSSKIKQKDSVTEKFPGVLVVVKKGRKSIYTKNLVPGKKVYGESLVNIKGAEYREWNPKRSKLGAGIMKGILETGLKEGSIVLYLGAASGTTVSHVSDILGSKGFVFALDFAPRVVRDLVYVSEDRRNIAPILGDADKPDSYMHRLVQVDMIFQDIAQRSQAEIFLKNVNMYLKKDGIAIIAVKARSIDVTKKPSIVFEEVRNKLKELRIIDYKVLEPFEKDHCIFVCKR
ncbi:fibrillarin-like rRNA/tRNA 2'-O-methyltransferase [Candidatus Woesearchaeota archaeon]|nr:fibrillarin-like rRNA/tRNA 2'-O-methyltransferase [Candidatus Woesearchaeota archaeon]